MEMLSACSAQFPELSCSAVSFGPFVQPSSAPHMVRRFRLLFPKGSGVYHEETAEIAIRRHEHH